MDFIKELFIYIYSQRKWWLAPIIILLLIVGLFVLFADTAIAPFIYTLF